MTCATKKKADFIQNESMRTPLSAMVGAWAEEHGLELWRLDYNERRPDLRSLVNLSRSLIKVWPTYSLTSAVV